MVSRAEKARRQALSEGDLKGAAAAEVSLLTAVLEAQFGQAHVEAGQGLIMLQVHTSCKTADAHVPEQSPSKKMDGTNPSLCLFFA